MVLVFILCHKHNWTEFWSDAFDMLPIRAQSFFSLRPRYTVDSFDDGDLWPSWSLDSFKKTLWNSSIKYYASIMKFLLEVIQNIHLMLNIDTTNWIDFLKTVNTCWISSCFLNAYDTWVITPPLYVCLPCDEICLISVITGRTFRMFDDRRKKTTSARFLSRLVHLETL